MDEYDKIEKPRIDYFKKHGIKTCKKNHSFNVETNECKHKHCSKCGMCQAVNGCFQIINNALRTNKDKVKR